MEIRSRTRSVYALLFAGLLAACAPGATQTGSIAPTAALKPTLERATSTQAPAVPTAPPTATPTARIQPTATSDPTATAGPPATPTTPPTSSPEPTATTIPATATRTSSPIAPTATSPPSPVPSATRAAEALTPTLEPADRAALVDKGLQVYLDQYCGLCHQLSAANTTGIFGPGHDGMGSLAAERLADPSYAGQANSAAGYILESIVEPQTYLVPGYAGASQPMPGYGFLTDEEIMALVEMLLAQTINE